MDERYKYLRMMYPRYSAANRKERGRLLDEIVAMMGLNRKYGARVDDAVRVVADALDWICAERLQPALAKTAAHLASFGEVMVTVELLEDLRSVSVSTLYRIMKRIRHYEPRLPQRRGKSKSRGLTADIPMTRLACNISEPGHFEMDLVHHCGTRTHGDYLCTLQMIDIATS